MQRISERIKQIGFFSGHSFSHVECTGSTNDDLKKLIEQGSFYNIRMADHQTRGRGQFGRVWLSKPGKSLLFSFSGDEPVQKFPLSLLTGIAVYSALKKYIANNSLWLKWPNDIFLDSGKLGGILVERLVFGDRQFFVVGVGINLQAPEQFNAAGLDRDGIDGLALLLEILASFSEHVDSDPAILLEKWTTAAGQFWEKTFYCHAAADMDWQKQKPSSIKPMGICEDGSLRILRDGKEVKIVSASLSLAEDSI